MRTSLLASVGKMADFLPLRPLIAVSGQRLLLPVYHLSSDEHTPHIDHIYPVRNTRLFRQDLDFFLKYYEPVSFEQVLDHVNGTSVLKRNSFFISFDDGLREIHDVVAPILKEKGIPAAFFVNTDFIDNQGLFFRYKASLLVDHLLRQSSEQSVLNQVAEILKIEANSSISLPEAVMKISYPDRHLLDKMADLLGIDFLEFLEDYQPYLTTGQIKSLQKDGFTIGAHSCDHPEYRLISLEEQIRQTEECLEVLNHDFGIGENTFAFPFTDYGVGKAFFDHIYQGRKVSLSFGCAGIKQDITPRHLHRLPMEGTLLPAASIVKAEYAYYLLKMPLGKNRLFRK